MVIDVVIISTQQMLLIKSIQVIEKSIFHNKAVNRFLLISDTINLFYRLLSNVIDYQLPGRVLVKVNGN